MGSHLVARDRCEIGIPACGGDGILLVTIFDPKLRRYEGMTLAEISKELGRDPRDVLMDIVITDRGLTSAANFVIAEDDVRNALRSPFVISGPIPRRKQRMGRFRALNRTTRLGIASRDSGKYVREECLLECILRPGLLKY